MSDMQESMILNTAELCMTDRLIKRAGNTSSTHHFLRAQQNLINLLLYHHNDPKFSYRKVWKNSVDPDQTALSGAD